MTDPFRTILAPLPPSAKLVYKVLEYEGPSTQTAIAEETLLPVRTVRYALSKLDAADVVDDRSNPFDARQRIYFLDLDYSDGHPAVESGRDRDDEAAVVE